MGIIHELDVNLINKIAAGEVIESAHSVIKELLENSIDAKSNQIDIQTESGGLSQILVSDNGTGIAEEDLPLAVKRHATSKIKNLDDLETVLTYGFRGEALSSIASVSKLKLTTETSQNSPAIEILCDKGEILNKKNTTGFKGTKIEVEDLFYNTPVRRKFLKSEKAEDKKIKDRIAITAIANPNIGFRYIQNQKEIFNLKPESTRERIVSVFGDNLENHLLEVNSEKKGIKGYGFISDPEFYKSNRSGQFLFVNGRPIEMRYSSYLLKKAYDELIPTQAHPWCFIFFEIDPKHIDVNVHPTKKEIRFLDEEGFNSFFLQMIHAELNSKTPVGILEMRKRFFNEGKRAEAIARANSLLSPTFFSTNTNSQSRDTQEILHDSLYEEVKEQVPFSVETVGAGTNLHELTQTPERKREFIPKKHFGIIFETFILAEAEDGIYIIDQHTAHERIRYEEVLNQLKEKNLTQQLLTPIRIDLAKSDAEEILERKDEYAKVGITLDDLGGGTILVREIPVFLDPGKEKETILDFLNRTKGEKVLEKELYDLMAKCVACRSAIKKGDHMSDHILGEILNRLSYCENPSRCPHGRPTLIKLTRDDLEKMFHRK
ncbi:MAG TPA: DNA mismatch repair endonuclease MutL [Leptospiraceae bacterium]|nr:DNA mismatch repair endonuclease MutL [Leptospiraceae bacterium]